MSSVAGTVGATETKDDGDKGTATQRQRTPPAKKAAAASKKTKPRPADQTRMRGMSKGEVDAQQARVENAN
jgi:hypothetical protein